MMVVKAITVWNEGKPTSPTVQRVEISWTPSTSRRLSSAPRSELPYGCTMASTAGFSIHYPPRPLDGNIAQMPFVAREAKTSATAEVCNLRRASRNPSTTNVRSTWTWVMGATPSKNAFDKGTAVRETPSSWRSCGCVKHLRREPSPECDLFHIGYGVAMIGSVGALGRRLHSPL